MFNMMAGNIGAISPDTVVGSNTPMSMEELDFMGFLQARLGGENSNESNSGFMGFFQTMLGEENPNESKQSNESNPLVAYDLDSTEGNAPFFDESNPTVAEDFDSDRLNGPDTTVAYDIDSTEEDTEVADDAAATGTAGTAAAESGGDGVQVADDAAVANDAVKTAVGLFKY